MQQRVTAFQAEILDVKVTFVRPSDDSPLPYFKEGPIYGGPYQQMEAFLFFSKRQWNISNGQISTQTFFISTIGIHVLFHFYIGICTIKQVCVYVYACAKEREMDIVRSPSVLCV